MIKLMLSMIGKKLPSGVCNQESQSSLAYGHGTASFCGRTERLALVLFLAVASYRILAESSPCIFAAKNVYFANGLNTPWYAYANTSSGVCYAQYFDSANMSFHVHCATQPITGSLISSDIDIVGLPFWSHGHLASCATDAWAYTDFQANPGYSGYAHAGVSQ